jgi:DNA/RNA endonuclease YhcR with UshA esterase domain
VPAQNVASVGGEEFLRSLADNVLTISGKIELYKGKPEVMISSPSQIVKE